MGYSVINYSEIWDRVVYTTADGTFIPLVGEGGRDNEEEDNKDLQNTSSCSSSNNNNGKPKLFGIRNLSQGKNQQQRKKSYCTSSVVDNKNRKLRNLPDTFQVTATGGTLHLLGGLVLVPLPFIVGSSKLVTLYSDPRLHIFVSPLESRSVVGNWDEAGLVVVQVRNDLVNGDPPNDLR